MREGKNFTVQRKVMGWGVGKGRSGSRNAAKLEWASVVTRGKKGREEVAVRKKEDRGRDWGDGQMDTVCMTPIVKQYLMFVVMHRTFLVP